ncbi:MAG: MFS transporter [Treponema sp.]|jgi:fucose permease|nr:MFS transporter [Treponema sp.]
MVATFFLGLIYLTFISLGLPDSLLGTVWPVMRMDLGASLDTAGIIFFIISGCTIISSLSCGWVVGRFGAGKVTAISVLLTASALVGASFSPSVWWLVLTAIPLGLGGGAVDAALNNYVALHYASRHMSWLHCFWGVGAFTGPLIISAYLRQGDNWRSAYLTLGIIQAAISLLLIISLSLWNTQNKGKALQNKEEHKPEPPQSNQGDQSEHTSIPIKKLGVLRIPGVIQALITFFIYCATEYTLGLWGASFLTEIRGFAKAAAAGAISMYFAGITIGRFVTGFLTIRFTGVKLIRTGICIITGGAVLLFLPLPGPVALPALLLIGLGCAPVYPSMIHLTPERFGAENSPKVIGLQMACAYSGSTFMPPLVGVIAARTTMSVVPLFLVCYGVAMFFMSERINRAAS